MKCPHCKEETFKHKPHLKPNKKSAMKYKRSEQRQILSHIKRHRKLIKGCVR